MVMIMSCFLKGVLEQPFESSFGDRHRSLEFEEALVVEPSGDYTML